MKQTKKIIKLLNRKKTLEELSLNVKAYNLLGQEVYSGQGDNLRFGESLKSGIYILNINGKMRKVMKLR